ncbi:MAG: hypothetical protein BGN88_14175 [Clostridiales bacterium 43-6]|nr:MAG: hypothetical protein BGN88_14175 [Clostridiales bacterium 43-6]
MDAGNVSALTTRAKYGDKEAFGELYALIWRDLYKYALFYLGNREDAEDAVGEAVIAAYSSIYQLREPDAFKGWMYKLLSNSCKKKLKTIIQGRNSLRFDGLELSYDIMSSEEMHTAAELYESLNSLSPVERQIILLSVVGGYKSDEIARLLHKPSGTVRSALCRALKKLRTDFS